MRLVRAIGLALLISMSVPVVSASAFQESTPTPTPDPVATPTSTSPINTGGNAGLGTNSLGDFSASWAAVVKYLDSNDAIPPIEPATRPGVHSAIDRPCYQLSTGLRGSPLTGDAPELSFDERRELGLATDAENLAVINGQKIATKEPARRSRRVAADQDFIDAIFDIFAREEALKKPTTGVVAGSGAGQCATEYYCSAERVDDVVSGHIDSEPDGTYAEYVNDVALVLDDSSADIRRVESLATPEIPRPSSPESQKSLASALAERGLDTRPSELFMPVFNFCRQGEDGTIETQGEYAVSFTWTFLGDEFDTDASSRLVFDGLERQLLGELPQMRTIPPIDEGVTIVKFPMWLWLDEPFPGAAFEQVSRGNHIRMRGRAALHHVVWKLGDTEIICELDDMQEYVFDGSMSPADKPVCSHTFFDLVEYTMTAQVVYRLEQQLSYRQTLFDPWPDAPWEPHPIQEFVPVESSTGTMSVEEIWSFNTPINEPVDDE